MQEISKQVKLISILLETEKFLDIEVPPTPEALVNHYFDDDFMFTMVNLSNTYAFERKHQDPKLSCWKNKKSNKDYQYAVYGSLICISLLLWYCKMTIKERLLAPEF